MKTRQAAVGGSALLLVAVAFFTGYRMMRPPPSNAPESPLSSAPMVAILPAGPTASEPLTSAPEAAPATDSTLILSAAELTARVCKDLTAIPEISANPQRVVIEVEESFQNRLGRQQDLSVYHGKFTGRLNRSDPQHHLSFISPMGADHSPGPDNGISYPLRPIYALSADVSLSPANRAGDQTYLFNFRLKSIKNGYSVVWSAQYEVKSLDQ